MYSSRYVISIRMCCLVHVSNKESNESTVQLDSRGKFTLQEESEKGKPEPKQKTETMITFSYNTVVAQ